MNAYFHYRRDVNNYFHYGREKDYFHYGPCTTTSFVELVSPRKCTLQSFGFVPEL